jgi:hypothetical protein
MRETKSITTKFGKNVVKLKTFLTERESRDVLAVLAQSYSFKVDGSGETEKISSDTVLQYQNKLIETWVVEIDGKTEGLVELMLDFRKEDFKQVVDEITKISGTDEKKTK